MKIVFDSNVWEKVVDLDAYPYKQILQKIKLRHIYPFICEAAISLESIRKLHRAGFFNSYEPKVEFQSLPSTGDTFGTRVCFSANNELHPPLPEVLLQRLQQAARLGFKVIRMGRFGTVRSSEIPEEMFCETPPETEFWKEAERFAECEGFIYDLPAGQYQYELMVNKLRARGLSVAGVASNVPPGKRKKFSEAIAEWVDGDSLAACYSKGISYFCTDDRGRNAGATSVFGAANIARVAEVFGINVLSSNDVAQL